MRPFCESMIREVKASINASVNTYLLDSLKGFWERLNWILKQTIKILIITNYWMVPLLLLSCVWLHADNRGIDFPLAKHLRKYLSIVVSLQTYTGTWMDLLFTMQWKQINGSPTNSSIWIMKLNMYWCIVINTSSFPAYFHNLTATGKWHFVFK